MQAEKEKKKREEKVEYKSGKFQRGEGLVNEEDEDKMDRQEKKGGKTRRERGK